MLNIRVVYDGWFEVELRTPKDRFGLADGTDLEKAIEEAEVMIVELDRVVEELRSLQG